MAKITTTQIALLVARNRGDVSTPPFEPGVGSFTFTGYAPDIESSFFPLAGEFAFTGYIPSTKSFVNAYNVSPGLGITHVWSSQANKAVAADTIFGILDYAIAGQVAADFDADTDLSLTADEVKNVFIEVTDTGVVLTTTRLVFIPSGSRMWWVKNSTAQSLTFTPVANSIDEGTGATVTAGKNALLRVDGFTAYAKELD